MDLFRVFVQFQEVFIELNFRIFMFSRSYDLQVNRDHEEINDKFSDLSMVELKFDMKFFMCIFHVQFDIN